MNVPLFFFKHWNLHILAVVTVVAAKDDLHTVHGVYPPVVNIKNEQRSNVQVEYLDCYASRVQVREGVQQLKTSVFNKRSKEQEEETAGVRLSR